MLVPPLLQLCLGPDKPAGLSPGPGAPCDMPSVQFLWVTWCGAYRPSSTIFTSNQLTSHYCVMLLWTGPGNSGSVCFPHLGPDHFLHQYRVSIWQFDDTDLRGQLSSPPRLLSPPHVWDVWPLKWVSGPGRGSHRAGPGATNTSATAPLGLFSKEPSQRTLLLCSRQLPSLTKLLSCYISCVPSLWENQTQIENKWVGLCGADNDGVKNDFFIFKATKMMEYV